MCSAGVLHGSCEVRVRVKGRGKPPYVCTQAMLMEKCVHQLYACITNSTVIMKCPLLSHKNSSLTSTLAHKSSNLITRGTNGDEDGGSSSPHLCKAILLINIVRCMASRLYSQRYGNRNDFIDTLLVKGVNIGPSYL